MATACSACAPHSARSGSGTATTAKASPGPWRRWKSPRVAARAAGDLAAAAAAMEYLGIVAYARDDYAGAERTFLEGIAAARLAGDRNSERSFVGDLGHVAMLRGALDEAVGWLEQSLAWDDV